MLVQQRQVELQLPGEVLVEHRLAHPGAVGDVVHGGRVVAVRDEHLLGGTEQLFTAGASRQAGTARALLRLLDGRHGAPHFGSVRGWQDGRFYFSVTAPAFGEGE